MRTIAHAARRPGDRRRRDSRREQHDHRCRRRRGCSRALDPSGAACRRTWSGSSTTRTSGSSRCSSSAPHDPLQEERVADLERRLARRDPPPLRWIAENDEVAALGDHARERGLADEPGAWGDRRPPRRRVPRVSRLSGSTSSPYCSTSVRAWVLKSRLIALADVASGAAARRGGRRSRPSRPAAGSPTRANSKKPNAPDTCVVGRLGDDDVHRRRREDEQRPPACAAKASGIRSWEGARRVRTAITTTTGSEGGDRAVRRDRAPSARRRASIVEHERTRPAVTGTA